MQSSLRRLRAVAIALALAACAKQQPLPVANFVGITNDALTVATGQQIILDASNSTDPSGGDLSFEWSFAALPAGSRAKIESPHNAKTRFTPDVSTSVTDKYVVSLVVKNQYFLSAPHLLTITALDCGANVPQVNSITPSPTSINISTPVLLTASVTDRDNDAECQGSLGNVKQTEKYLWRLTALPAGSRAALRDPAAVLGAFTPDVAGTYTATLAVTDSTGRRSEPFSVNVQVADCGGAAPGVNSVTSAPSSPNLGQNTQLTADVGDADVDNPTCGLKQGKSYAWTVVGLPQGSGAKLNDPAAINPSFTPDLPGDYAFRLVVTDSTGRASAPATLVVTVKNCGGAPPTPIVQFTPASAGIGLPVSLKVTPQDDDALCGISETFTYLWTLVAVPGGSHARIVAPQASAASLVPDVGGDYAINVTIADSRGTSASALTHLTVAGCGNNPPSVDGLTGLPLTPLVGQNVHVTALVSDADSSCAGFDPVQTFRWGLSMRPAGSAAALVDPTARAADFAPDVIGHYQLSLVVTDATGLPSAPALFDVQTSTCGSSAPQIVSVGASSPAPDPGTPFTLFAQTSDPDNGGGCSLGQAISLRWEVSSRPAGSSATLSNPAAATPSFTADVPGSYQFSVVATDSTGRSSAPSFLTLGTTSCGTAIPAVTAVPASTTVQPFQAVHLLATPSDADTSCILGDTFTYAWKVVSAPAGSGAMLSNPGAAAPSFAPDLGGSYQLSVTVQDSRGHVSSPAFVNIGVAACAQLLPIAGALSATAPSLGLPVTLSAPSARPQGCGASATLQYAWTLAGPSGSRAVLDNPIAPAPRFTPDVAGAYQAVLTVRDSHGLDSTPAVLNLAVAPCGTSNLSWLAAPELTPSFTEPDGSTPAATLVNGVWSGAFTGTSIALQANFVDPPGCGTLAVEPFTYQWALVSRPAGSAAHLDSQGAAMPSFVPDLPGDYQVAGRVGDATGALLPARFATVHVPGCGTTLPVVGITPPGSTSLNTFQTLHLTVAGGTATDADNLTANCPARFAPGTNFAYAWSVSPAGAVLASATGAVDHSNDFTAGTPGTYTVQLVATAANGIRSLPASLVLTVGDCGSHAPAIMSVSTMVGGVASSRPQVNQNVTVTAVAMDTDMSGACGDSIASYEWALASAPTGSVNATAPGAGASFSFTPDVAGTYQYTVVATDSRGLRSAPYTVSVETAICAPSVASISPFIGITPLIGSPNINQTLTLKATGTADTCVQAPVFAWAWRIVSAPLGSTARLSSSTGISTDFTADAVGAYQFEVVATDQAGFSSAPVTLQLSAGTCGSTPPSLAAIVTKRSGLVVSNGGFDAGDQLVLSSAHTDNNTPCGALTQPFQWHWTLLSKPSGSSATLAQGDVTPGFVPDLPGSYQVSAQVTDALGNVSLESFATLTTSTCGVNPVEAAILPTPSGPQLLATVNTPLALTANVTDKDNTAACPLRFAVSLGQQWSILTAPAGAQAALSSTTTGATAFTASAAGNYVVGLVGTASNGLSSTLATVSINASACGANPPSVISVTTGTSRPQVGTSVTLSANLFDLDNQPACQAVLGGVPQTFTFAWTPVSLPAGASVNTSTTTKDLTFTAGVAGTFTFDVVARDSAGFSSAPFRSSIATAGCGPTLGTISATGTSVGAPVPVSLSSATDSCVVSSTPLSYFWSLASRPLTSNAFFANPALAGNTFTPDVPGSYDILVTVTDAGGFSSSADKVISVGGCSAGPTVSINAPRSFFGGAEVSPALDRDDSVSLSATVTGGGCGASTPTYTYEWSIQGRPPGSTSQLSSASAASPSFTLDAAGGTWGIMLIVKDQLGNPSTAQFASLTSSTCGARAPVISGLPATLNTNTFQLQSLAVTAPDPDLGCPARFADLPISFAWSVRSQPAGAPAPTFTASGGSASFTANFPGAYEVQVTAAGKDNVSSAPSIVAITAAQCGYNAPSIAGALTASQSAPGTATPPFAARVDIALGASVTDADNAPGACGTTPAQAEFQQWLLISAPPGSVAQITSANGSSPHFTPDLAGSYTVQLTASDSTGLSSSKQLTFAVSACGTHAPTAGTLAASQVLAPGNTLHAAPFALGVAISVDPPVITDLDNTTCTPAFPAQYTLAWGLQAAPGSQAQLANTGTTSPSFVPDATGVYTVSLTVTDTTGLSSTSTFGIDVECGNALPVAASFTATQVVPSLNTNAGPVTNFTIVRSTNAGSVQNGNVPFYPQVPVSLSATVTDANSACSPPVFSYAWSLAKAPPGSAAVILNPSSPSPSLVPDLTGEYDVQLTLTDSTGQSSTTVFSTSAPSTPLLPVGLCGIQAPQARIGVASPIAAAAPTTQISLPISSAVLLDGTPSRDGDNDALLLTSANVPPPPPTPPPPSQVSGCGLSQPLSYHWTVTGAPAAAQPFSIARPDLPNPGFTASQPGNYDLRLTVSDGSRSGDAPISIHSRGVGSSTVAATPANVSFIVGPANGANIVTTVLDTDGNPLAAVPVSLAVTSGLTGNTLSPTSGSTNASGQFTGLLTSTKAGTGTKNGETKVVSATSGTLPLGSASVAFAPGPVHDIFWFVQPCDTPAGVIDQCGPGLAFPEVDGEDQFANVVTAYTSSVALTTFSEPSGGPHVTVTTPKNAGTPFNDLSVDTTGAYQLQAAVTDSPALPGGNTVLSNVFNGTLPPANPPVLSSSTATTPNQILITWAGSLNNAGKRDKTILRYHVFRAPGAVTPPDPSFVDIAAPTIASGVCGGATSFNPCSFTDTDAALTDGTQFTYYIEADNNGIPQGSCTPTSCSAPSNTTQQFTMPGAATSLTADASTTPSTVNLSWRPPTTGIISSYDVLSSPTSGGTYTAVATGITTNCALPNPACTFSDTSVGNNTQVFYKIQTNITTGASPAHAPASNLTSAVGALTLPGPVAGLAATSVSHNSVTLNWTAQTNISTYRVFRGTTTAGVYPDTFTVGTNTFVNNAATNSPVYPGVGYHYAVVAVNATGSSPGTPTDVLATTPAAPWVPSNAGLPGGGFLNAMAADQTASGGGLVYAGTGKLTDATTAGGIFKFTPASSAWNFASNGIPNGSIVTAFAFEVVAGVVQHLYAGTRGQGIFVSGDGGLTWNPVAATGLGNGTVTALFVDNTRTLWAGGDTSAGGGIFSLAVGAASWTTSLGGPTQTVQAFAQDLNTGDMWAQLGAGAGATPPGGLWHFSGGSWSLDANQPSLGATDCSLTRANASAFAIDSNPATSVLYWGSKTCGLLFRPVTPVATTWANVVGYTTTEITRLLVFDAGTNLKVWVASAEVGAANGVTFLQPNKGAAQQVNHMTNPAYPANDWEPTALASDPRSSRTNLWAGSQDGTGAYLSINATASGGGVGGSFTKTNSGLNNFNVRSIVRDPDNSHLVAAGDLIGVAASADQGANWSMQTLTGCTTVVSLAYNTANATAFATCQGVTGVFVGTANGTSWTKKNCTGLTSANFTRGIVVQNVSPTDVLYIATAGSAPSTPATIWKTDASTGGSGNPGNTCTAVATLPNSVQDVSALGIDAAGDLFAGSASNFVHTLATGAGTSWLASITGPKNVVRFFLNTTGTDTMYAAGQDDGTNAVGGVWSAATGTITNTVPPVWTLVPASPANVVAGSFVTAFNGLVPNTNPPILFAGTALTPGQQYSNMFRFTSGNWTAEADGLNGANVLGITIPNANTVAVGSAHVLAATSAGGIFKTTSGGQ